MSIKGMLAVTLAMALVVGSVAPVAVRAAQDNGVLGGKATDKAKQPYSDYTIRLRNADAPGIIKTASLDTQGQFTFGALPLSRSYLIELFRVKDSKIVCTEGPYTLDSTMTTKTDINIDCGKNPTAWIIVGGAGLVLLAATTPGGAVPQGGAVPTITAATTQSSSK